MDTRSLTDSVENSLFEIQISRKGMIDQRVVDRGRFLRLNRRRRAVLADGIDGCKRHHQYLL